MSVQWGPLGEWTEVPAHPTCYGDFRYRKVGHRDGMWHGLQVEQRDRNGRWVSVGKEFNRGFAVGRLVPENEWPSFASGPSSDVPPPDGEAPGNERIP